MLALHVDMPRDMLMAACTSVPSTLPSLFRSQALACPHAETENKKRPADKTGSKALRILADFLPACRYRGNHFRIAGRLGQIERSGLRRTHDDGNAADGRQRKLNFRAAASRGARRSIVRIAVLTRGVDSGPWIPPRGPRFPSSTQDIWVRGPDHGQPDG